MELLVTGLKLSHWEFHCIFNLLDWARPKTRWSRSQPGSHAYIGEAEMKPEQEPCRHHWIIQPVEGPISLGVCRLCLEEKEFQNNTDDWWTVKKPGPRHRPDSTSS